MQCQVLVLGIDDQTQTKQTTLFQLICQEIDSTKYEHFYHDEER